MLLGVDSESKLGAFLFEFAGYGVGLSYVAVILVSVGRAAARAVVLCEAGGALRLCEYIAINKLFTHGAVKFACHDVAHLILRFTNELMARIYVAVRRYCRVLDACAAA